MELKKLTYHAVLALPSILLPDALYYIKPNNSEYVDWVITDSQGVPYEIMSNERIESLVLPYDDSVLPINGQTVVFNGTNFVPQNLPVLQIPIDITNHITRTDNPHGVQEDQIPSGLDYTLLFENALI